MLLVRELKRFEDDPDYLEGLSWFVALRKNKRSGCKDFHDFW